MTTDISSGQVLQAEVFDLWGSRLIEASAGTGKTWTIAALYLRLVLGHGAQHGFTRPLRPPEILVMTFTRAATRELSNRIRERLLSAARCFRGECKAEDALLQDLLDAYQAGPLRNRAAWALATAAENMDDASIHTIDAWCQRMLKEHAFDSGSLFDEQLVADEAALRIEATQDYWREGCYPLAADALSAVLKIWSGVEALITDMRELINQHIPPEAANGTLTSVLQTRGAQRSKALAALKTGWVARSQAMQDWLTTQLPAKQHGWTTLRQGDFIRWLNALKEWAEGSQDESPEAAMGKTAWERLTPAGMEKVRAPDSPAINLPAEFTAFAELKVALAQLPEVSSFVRLHAAANIARRLLLLKRQTCSFGFSDMLQRLHSALQGENGVPLRERILAQYPVILLDEFQDTSPLQYQIFDQIYQTASNNPQSALLLIGDPKQSIYGFRGADIYSYMQAREATRGRHYVLETNYRSTEALVSTVNHCFGSAERRSGEGAFMYRKPEDNPLPFEPVRAFGRREQFVTGAGIAPAMTLVHELALNKAEDIRKQQGARCAEQIVCWLNDPQSGFAVAGDEAAFRPLLPSDIAILVRTGKEAAAVRRELTRRQVPSVYLSDKESVFASGVAHDLVHWLRAVAMPQDVRLVRTALAIATLGLSLEELEMLACHDEAFDARCDQLRQLRSVWQAQGVLAMLRQTLHQMKLAAGWLTAPEGERKLTNFLHLAELLQAASNNLEGEQALIRWLLTEIDTGDAKSDEQVVRLESDAGLVKVITIHKSKGLEYPLVCLPYATSFRGVERRSTAFLNLADESGQRKLSLQFDDAELARADRERQREDLRLLYVALTRARHGLWVGFAAVKKGKNCVAWQSGAGYIFGGTADTSDWLALLQRFACADIVLLAAAQNTPCTLLLQADSVAPLQEVPDYQADFERNWTIGSFSRLAKDLSSVTSALSPLQVSRGADDEFASSNKLIAAREFIPAHAQQAAQGWHKFIRGPQAGNFLHDQLEWLAEQAYALPGNELLAVRLSRRGERAGYGAYAEEIVSWLAEVVQTRLPGPDAALVELLAVLPEMEFWLPAQRLESKAFDALCQQYLLPGVERPLLADRQLHGMLLGFADLVFEHQGKYWILDYKSNHLGEDDAAYSSDALARSMAEHRYDIQAAIYLLALHRLLKDRLGSNYHPEQQLGGAVYLFLRGIKGPQNGVCLIPACIPLLDALDTMLSGEL